MEKQTKILTANCVYCNKEVASLYRGQLDYNLAAHELSCPHRQKVKEAKNEKKAAKNKEKTVGRSG